MNGLKNNSSNSYPTSKNSKTSYVTREPTIQIGKLPPQALELEKAVLGALMLEKEAVNIVIEILQPESFYIPAHKDIYEAIKQLFEETKPIDLLTVTEKLKSNGKLDLIGGDAYVAALTLKVASAANVEEYSRIISEKFIKRKLIEISSKIITDSYDETVDVLDLLDSAEKELFGIAEGSIRKNYESMSDIIRTAIKKMDEIKDKSNDGVSGVYSGFKQLDDITSGWQPSDLIIIAARPAMGKTSFLLSLARNAAVDHNIPVAIFTLEMSSVQLVTRLISAESEVSSDKIMRGKVESYEIEQIHSKIKKLSEAKIFIDDTAKLSILELRAKSRRLKQQHDIKLICVDYLQLMSGANDNKNGNREQEISNISRSLKSIAKELEVPVIALAQLNRSVETRGGDKKPQLSDLRDSGSIEQDADMVQFIHRPEYYNITEDENGNSLLGKANIIIAKNRNGPVDTITLKFIQQLTKFENLENEAKYATSDTLEENADFNNSEGSVTLGSRINNEDENPF